MRMIKEESLTSFEFWSGAKENATYFTIDELSALDDILDSYQEFGKDEPFTETEINDMFWFEPGMLLNLIHGYDEDDEQVWLDRYNSQHENLGE